jgi:hypothetical protein
MKRGKMEEREDGREEGEGGVVEDEGEGGGVVEDDV